jgi:hypothetical protein
MLCVIATLAIDAISAYHVFPLDAASAPEALAQHYAWQQCAAVRLKYKTQVLIRRRGGR